MRAALPTTLLALLIAVVPAAAQQLTLSTQLDYVLLDQGFRDPDRHTSTSGFFPRLNLSLTGPIRPGARLYLDITGGLSRDSFGLSSQSADNIHFVLRGEAPHYRLSLRYGNAHLSSTTGSLDLGPSQLLSGSRETGLTLIVQQPAWPALNLQYSRFGSSSSLGDTGSTADSTNRRVSATYDLAPLHFRLDDSHSTSNFAGGDAMESNARRYGVSLDTTILPKLSLYGDVQLSHSDARFGRAPLTGTDSRIGQIRLSGELTPKVAVDATVYSQLLDTFPGSGASDLAARGSSVSMRSEVWPGLQLNFTANTNHAKWGSNTSDTTSIYADLLARIDAHNSLAFSLSPTRTTFSGSSPVSQSAHRAAWSSDLDSRTSLTVGFDGFTDDGASLSDRSASKCINLSYRPDLQTTLGVGLLWNSTESHGTVGQTTQDSRAIQANYSWLPTSDLSLGLHLSLSQLDGATQSQLRVPAFDIHWQPDSKTDFTLSWRAQSELRREFDSTSRLGFSAFSSHFSRRLSRGSNLNVDYDVIKFIEGPFAYERRLGVSLTTGLGR
jgi:hypothetical protein